MKEMREKEFKHLGNGDANSHVCKVCFQSSTAAILLPCRHFCCKSSPTLPEYFLAYIFGNFLWLWIFSDWITTSCLPLQCVNLVHLLVLNVHYAAPIFQIDFLLLLLDSSKKVFCNFLHIRALFKFCTSTNI